MNQINCLLWQKLESFHRDDVTVRNSFTQRLAAENAWPLDFASRVIREYYKFLYLTQKAGHACTPSEEVDQAWHLHMVHTRSYWDGLCQGVLQKPLHHDPTEGGQAETVKFADWYGKTLASYERIFGVAPPSDIWPATARRFASEPRWVDMKSNWVVPKDWFGKVVRAMAVLGLAWGLTSCIHGSGMVGAASAGFLGGWSGIIFSWMIGVAWVVWSLLVAKRKPMPGTPLDDYEACLLRGGPVLMKTALLGKLFRLGLAKVQKQRGKPATVERTEWSFSKEGQAVQATLSSWEQGALEQMSGQWASRWGDRLRPSVAAFKASLRSRGWQSGPVVGCLRTVLCLVLFLVIPLFLAVGSRVVNSVSVGSVIVLGLISWLTASICLARQPWYVRQHLRQLKETCKSKPKKDSWLPEQVPYVLAGQGTDGFSPAGITPVRPAFDQMREAASGSSDSGTSDSHSHSSSSDSGCGSSGSSSSGCSSSGCSSSGCSSGGCGGGGD